MKVAEHLKLRYNNHMHKFYYNSTLYIQFLQSLYNTCNSTAKLAWKCLQSQSLVYVYINLCIFGITIFLCATAMFHCIFLLHKFFLFGG